MLGEGGKILFLLLLLLYYLTSSPCLSPSLLDTGCGFLTEWDFSFSVEPERGEAEGCVSQIMKKN